MIDNNMLEALCFVIECGGFEKAAKALFISQSAVSQRIRLLEERLGQVLVVRTSPPKPTAAGRLLFKYYKQVKYLEDEALARLVSGDEARYMVFSLGVNADSLATWFFDIITDFFQFNNVLFHLIVDDQEETHKLLKDGDVVGCISASSVAVQGCSCQYLGDMQYKFAASPDFCEKWFGNGVNFDSAVEAPAVMFNTKDTLHYQLFKTVFHKLPSAFRTHYVPSSEQLLRSVVCGLGYGVVPCAQAKNYFKSGELVDLFPGVYVDVHLYWHCWNIGLRFLQQFTETLVDASSTLLST